MSSEMLCESTRDNMSTYSCLELVSGIVARSKGGGGGGGGGEYNWCLRQVDCQSYRYAVCEWRGDSIQSFSAHLDAQLLNAYVSVFGVLTLFALIWSLIYALSSTSMHANIRHALGNYQKQLELFGDEIKKIE